MATTLTTVFFTADPGELYEAASPEELFGIATDSSAVRQTRPPGTLVPTTNAGAPEILFGLVSFVIGTISAATFTEIGKDLWSQLKRSLAKIVEQSSHRHEGDPNWRHHPRVELSMIQVLDERRTLKVQISIADKPSDLEIMFDNTLRAMPTILELAESHNAHFVRINENSFDVNNRPIMVTLYFQPPYETNPLNKEHVQSITIHYNG